MIRLLTWARHRALDACGFSETVRHCLGADVFDPASKSGVRHATRVCYVGKMAPPASKRKRHFHDLLLLPCGFFKHDVQREHNFHIENDAEHDGGAPIRGLRAALGRMRSKANGATGPHALEYEAATNAPAGDFCSTSVALWQSPQPVNNEVNNSKTPTSFARTALSRILVASPYDDLITSLVKDLRR